MTINNLTEMQAQRIRKYADKGIGYETIIKMLGLRNTTADDIASVVNPTPAKAKCGGKAFKITDALYDELKADIAKGAYITDAIRKLGIAKHYKSEDSARNAMLRRLKLDGIKVETMPSSVRVDRSIGASKTANAVSPNDLSAKGRKTKSQKRVSDADFKDVVDAVRAGETLQDAIRRLKLDKKYPQGYSLVQGVIRRRLKARGISYVAASVCYNTGGSKPKMSAEQTAEIVRMAKQGMYAKDIARNMPFANTYATEQSALQAVIRCLERENIAPAKMPVAEKARRSAEARHGTSRVRKLSVAQKDEIKQRIKAGETDSEIVDAMKLEAVYGTGYKQARKNVNRFRVGTGIASKRRAEKGIGSLLNAAQVAEIERLIADDRTSAQIIKALRLDKIFSDERSASNAIAKIRKGEYTASDAAPVPATTDAKGRKSVMTPAQYAELKAEVAKGGYLTDAIRKLGLDKVYKNLDSAVESIKRLLEKDGIKYMMRTKSEAAKVACEVGRKKMTEPGGIAERKVSPEQYEALKAELAKGSYLLDAIRRLGIDKSYSSESCAANCIGALLKRDGIKYERMPQSVAGTHGAASRWGKKVPAERDPIDVAGFDREAVKDLCRENIAMKDTIAFLSNELRIAKARIKAQ